MRYVAIVYVYIPRGAVRLHTSHNVEHATNVQLGISHVTMCKTQVDTYYYFLPPFKKDEKRRPPTGPPSSSHVTSTLVTLRFFNSAFHDQPGCVLSAKPSDRRRALTVTELLE